MHPCVTIYTLPGGIMPKRQTEGAIGYDVSLRAIVCPREMDPHNPNLRKTLFDFTTIPTNLEVLRHIRWAEDGPIYRMDPGESVLGGIGFITQMPYPMFYWIAPRSGLASRWGITVTNAPGTVDPDYRGEAGVLIYNRNATPFDLRHNMRIAQIIFQWALIPEIKEAATYQELDQTKRGSGGFGSTGL